MKVYNHGDNANQEISESTARYYKVQEVAEILQVPIKWVYERTRSGKIPTRKFGGHIRIPVDEFEAWEKEQTGIAQRA